MATDDWRRVVRIERNPPSDVPHDGLRSWDEVARLWRLQSGERITRQGVCRVAHTAIRKLRKAIEDDPRLAAELGIRTPRCQGGND